MVASRSESPSLIQSVEAQMPKALVSALSSLEQRTWLLLLRRALASVFHWMFIVTVYLILQEASCPLPFL